MRTLTKNIIGNRRLPIKLENETLLKNVTIHGQKGVQNILIKNGIIEKITGSDLSLKSGETFDLSGKLCIPGAIDTHAVFREPGREDVETLGTGALAAANGGYTQVCIMPSTSPPIDSIEMVQFIKEKTADYLVDVNVIATLSKGREGGSISSFAELAEEGAIGFTDGSHHVKSAKLMEIALDYCRMLDLPIIVKPSDVDLKENGQMHEGDVSTILGFYGIPSIAEETIISRDLQICEYVGGKIHFTNISTKKSVELIRQAKKNGIQVTCDVAIHNLVNTDEAIYSFNTDLKLDPPLRSQDHIDALIKGLNDGTIDIITSTHVPHSWEEKEAEFIYAPFGATSLETCIPLILDRLVSKKLISIDKMVELLCVNPATIFKLKQNKISAGEAVSITVLDLNQKNTVSEKQFLSKSTNSPYLGWELMGCVFGTFHNGQKFINKY